MTQGASCKYARISQENYSWITLPSYGWKMKIMTLSYVSVMIINVKKVNGKKQMKRPLGTQWCMPCEEQELWYWSPWLLSTGHSCVCCALHESPISLWKLPTLTILVAWIRTQRLLLSREVTRAGEYGGGGVVRRHFQFYDLASWERHGHLTSLHHCLLQQKTGN